MKNPWFRLYSEFATDPKVQAMTEVMQRRLVMLFCLRCSGDLGCLSDDEMAVAFRIGGDELLETKKLFQMKRFIDDGWCVLNWEKRQFLSDDVTLRVQKFRAKGKQKIELNQYETLQKRYRNGNETPPDTDTDTEEKKIKKRKVSKTKTNGIPDWIDSKLWEDFKEHRVLLKCPMTQKAEELSFKKLERFKNAGQSPNDVIQQSIERGWKTFYVIKDQEIIPANPTSKYDDWVVIPEEQQNARSLP